ncbi:MAG: hypothetical protein V3T05_08280, partial [Myxococcota bacterium]
MSDGTSLGDAFQTWTIVWLVCAGLSIAAALLLPIATLTIAERARSLVGRIERRHGGVWWLAAGLALIGLSFRLPFLSADPPARLLTFSAAFGSDEGVWAYLATEWCAGRNPL